MQSIKFILFVLFFFISGCSDPLVAKIEGQLPITEQRIGLLATALENGQVRNANLINQYAERVRQLKPDLQPLISEFKKDASTAGPMYLALVDRLNTVKTQPQMFNDNKAIYEELLNIYQAADITLFSDALSDPLNVLADMSDGQLPRVNSLTKQQSLAANNAQDFGTGSQLVGNPSYGQWQTNSSGMSFWGWYGMYSMLGNVMGGNRIGYNDWGRNRGYSYYNDYGRSRYTSPRQLNKQNQVDTRTKKSFSSRGQSYSSPYSKNRTGSSGLSRQSSNAQVSGNKFRTSSAGKSKYANKASLRNSKTNTSRGFRRGK